MPQKRKKLGPGSITSYKFPMLKGQEKVDFYNWINKHVSTNGLITEALKIKFMIDTMKVASYKGGSCIENKVDETKEIEDIDILDDGSEKKLKSETIDIEGLKRMLRSVERS
ncbi:hypothetical protein [Thermotalea metallivorans]|uniref:Uncharacterized protein n=1 Tax=Thermotalea metallivorans TaxID=520762 RepID=A0A140LA02_9FIRM|nr:hypothetical protein [Thermotalea metallivorans]KXG77377.1 hypothetical protein AN619_05030 [Thermotalea metallivorans]